VRLPRGSSDAALTPYHVDRSKLFVLNRIETIEGLDARADRAGHRVHAISVSASADEKETDEEGMLLRAADMIGQLGDPRYLRKANALYHEFEEIGMNKQFGYATPAI